MKRTNQEVESLIERIATEIRAERPAPADVDAAASRVWARLAAEAEGAPAAAVATPAERIRNCADFQSLIPAYLRRNLSDARALLLEDHTLECIPCRRAVKEARLQRHPAPAARTAPSKAGLFTRPAARWAIAAAVIITFGLVVAPMIQRLVPFGGGLDPVVQAVNGAVYLLDDAQAQAVAAGKEFRRNERIRTAKEAGAVVRLSDGSLIEMRERSEFYLTENAQGMTIHLDRGNIIVQAAKQRQRHLYVATGDCLVSVTGTIFSVNSGTKGSRVSVVEGEVQVDHSGARAVLHPGEQVTTHENLERVPVREEIAWSRDAGRYLQLLSGLEEVRRGLDAVAVPGVRHSTRLLDALPEGTVLYAALPNLGNTIADSYRVLQERIAQNESLRAWWAQGEAQRSGPDHLREIVGKVEQLGLYLGDELVISTGLDAQGRPAAPLVVGELKDAAGFRALLEREIEGAAERAAGRAEAVRFISDPLAAATGEAPAKDGLYIWISDDLFAAAPSADTLRLLATNLRSSAANRFRETSFHARLANLYRGGAGLVVAADLQQILARAQSAEKSAGTADKVSHAAADRLGLTGIQHFIFELKQQDGKGSNRAVLSFDGERRGMASWLAAPGPMGALEYISPDANVVAAFAVKEPAALVDDLLGTLQTIDGGLREHLSKFEQENGFDLRRDFAAPLGGEFAFAIDGPVLPSPSWKMVFEVNEPARLQQTFERLVEKLNELSAREGRRGFEWERTEGPGGRPFYTLKSVDFGLAVSYTYANGYFVMAPSRALLDRALRYHDAGITLLNSPKFTAVLPEDGQANFSALFYHNLTPLVEPFADRLPQAAAAGKMSEGGEKVLSTLSSLSPTLAYAYAQGDEITVSANTERGPFGLNPASLLSVSGSFGFQHVLDAAWRETKQSKP